MISTYSVTLSFQIVSTSLPGIKVRRTYLHFSSFRVVVAICQVWSIVPICSKSHILANSSTISPLSSFKTLGWMPWVPVIYLHLECHSRTSHPFTTACSTALESRLSKYNWGVGILLSISLGTANAKKLAQHSWLCFCPSLKYWWLHGSKWWSWLPHFLMPWVHIKRKFSDWHRSSLHSHPQIVTCSTMPTNSIPFRLKTHME